MRPSIPYPTVLGFDGEPYSRREAYAALSAHACAPDGGVAPVTTTLRALADEWGWSRTTVHRFLRWLADLGVIVVAAAGREGLTIAFRETVEIPARNDAANDARNADEATVSRDPIIACIAPAGEVRNDARNVPENVSLPFPPQTPPKPTCTHALTHTSARAQREAHPAFGEVRDRLLGAPEPPPIAATSYVTATLHALFDVVPNGKAWCAAILARLTGMHGPPVEPAVMLAAIEQYVAALGDGVTPNLRQFWRYVDGAKPLPPRAPAAEALAARQGDRSGRTGGAGHVPRRYEYTPTTEVVWKS